MPDDASAPAHRPGQTPPLWDIWCRVIDNHGDLGVCWRLACGLAARGCRVRLFVDDARALAWMAAPGQAQAQLQARIQVLDWQASGPWPDAGDVVIEAFGCDPPAAVVATMSQRPQPPTWLNLEYLSAESYVERSHRLPSPQPGGLTKWFFYPGFTPRTGGLLREDGLIARRQAFDAPAWLARRGWAPAPGERVVSLFCYDNPALPELMQQLASQPTLLLATPGPAQRGLQALSPLAEGLPRALPAGLRVLALPWLTQTDFDQLLWACDLNFVRGEDSLVRALWAGQPFVWQLYPQHDGAHAGKLQAFLRCLQAGSEVEALFMAWNGFGPGGLPPLPSLQDPGEGQAVRGLDQGSSWLASCHALRARLATQQDLVTQLLAFVAEREAARTPPVPRAPQACQTPQGPC